MPKNVLSVRTKLLLTVAACVVALSAAVYVISAAVLLPSYVAIEREAMDRDLGRAVDAIGEFSDAQMIKLSDWAAWDESYEFTIDRDPTWPPTSIYPDSMANLDNNLALFTDLEGEAFFVMVTDIPRREELPSDAVRAYFAEHKELVTHTDLESETEGLVMLPDGPMILVSLPVKNAAGEGPIHGSLSFGRFLDEEKVAELGEITHLSLSIYRYSDTALPEDVAAAKRELEGGAEHVVTPLGKDTLGGYALLRDVHNAPALILKVEEPRPVYAQGNATFSLYLLVGGLALILFGGIIIFLLDRLVISRFVRLTEDVAKVNDNRDLSRRVEGGVRDEIGMLADKINQLFAWLLQAREAEAATRREMVNLLDELKKGKEQAEEMKGLLERKD